MSVNKAGSYFRHLLTLTYKPADAHSTHGDDAGDLQRPAALRAHQTVPGLQAALGALAPAAPLFPRAVALRVLVLLGLTLHRVGVLFVPLLLAHPYRHGALARPDPRRAEGGRGWIRFPASDASWRRGTKISNANWVV